MEVEFMENVRDEIFYCKNCLNESKSKLSTSGFYSSISAKAKDNLDIYIGIRWNEEEGCTCPKCKNVMTNSHVTSLQLLDIIDYSNNNADYTLAMLELKNNNVIEFTNQMNIVKEKMDEKRQEWVNKKLGIDNSQESNQVRCPRCGSTQIGVINRGYSLFSGFLGSGSARNVCQKCGYKWKPGK